MKKNSYQLLSGGETRREFFGKSATAAAAVAMMDVFRAAVYGQQKTVSPGPGQQTPIPGPIEVAPNPTLPPDIAARLEAEWEAELKKIRAELEKIWEQLEDIYVALYWDLSDLRNAQQSGVRWVDSEREAREKLNERFRKFTKLLQATKPLVERAHQLTDQINRINQ